MTKTKRRKKSSSRASTGRVVVQEKVERAAPAGAAARGLPTRRPSLQNAVFALMLTLGFLGFAIFFTFFYTEDANHIIYGVAMALTALGWLALAARRWSSYRQYVRA
ncbi:MAG TPA: hypothetical protein VGM01_09295 [Ktedonobacteraceae bacterium]|jgi:hypothetical protein